MEAVGSGLGGLDDDTADVVAVIGGRIACDDVEVSNGMPSRLALLSCSRAPLT
jgi:hypothetical protein